MRIVSRQSAIQVVSVLLACYCGSVAWADHWSYIGERQMRIDHFARAFESFSNARKTDPFNPFIFYWAGRAKFNLGLQQKKSEELEKAKDSFEHYLHQRPYDGRGWMYLALAEMNFQWLTKDGLTNQEWKRIQSFFETAHDKEPGNLWISCLTSLSALSQKKILTPEEERQAEARLSQALSVHEPHLPSRYLGLALKRLWRDFSDFELLKRTVPKDVPSYKLFYEFLSQQELWQFLPEIEMTSYRMSQRLYEKTVDQGLFFLKKGMFAKAAAVFEKASGIDKSRNEALAGLWAAQTNLQVQFSAEPSQRLRALFEDDSGFLQGFFPYLGGLVRQGGEPYLEGLYALRTENNGLACSELGKISGKEESSQRRYFWAQACFRAGKTAKAIEILRPTVNDSNADLRELMLMADWVPEEKQIFTDKINRLVQTSMARNLWWANGLHSGVLDRKAKMYMGLNLKPGQNFLSIKARSLPDPMGRGAYMTVFLGDRLIGAAYVQSGAWQDFSFKVTTGGGKRRLSVNFINAADLTASRRRPILELGDVQIKPKESK